MMLDSSIRFLKSADFSKGLVLALAILIVLAVSYTLGKIDIGISLTMGMFISAPANFPGSNRHRINGMLAAIFLGIMNTAIINLVAGNLWLLTLVMTLLVFLISYLAVFGFRASLVAFSGLSAIIFSLAHPQTGLDIFIHAAWIGLGGLWYLLFSVITQLVTHKGHTIQLMAECMELTANYLRTRAEFALRKGDKEEMEKKLFELQSDLNTKHESLREILLAGAYSHRIDRYPRTGDRQSSACFPDGKELQKAAGTASAICGPNFYHGRSPRLSFPGHRKQEALEGKYGNG
jgi:hypothetical protein